MSGRWGVGWGGLGLVWQNQRQLRLGMFLFCLLRWESRDGGWEVVVIRTSRALEDVGRVGPAASPGL